jgi:hypothetical protein
MPMRTMLDDAPSRTGNLTGFGNDPLSIAIFEGFFSVRSQPCA